MATLAEIQAKLRESQSKSSGQASGGDSTVYPHWNMPEGKEAVIRFLPDGNSDNTFFWTERAMIKLPFAGIKGETDSRQVEVQVPCVEMYNDGSVCPILSEVRGWFKDKSLEEMGRKYWKKRSYIFQGFVVEDSIKEEKAPDNPIRRFIIGPQIYRIIQSALLDPELEDLPTDYLRGVDFRIAKTSKGGFADYSTSKWSRRERALSESDLEAINTHKLYNLNEFLPKKPTDVELKVMKEMFEASVNGEAYDAERWGNYFKPAGMRQATGDPHTQASSKPAVSNARQQDAEADDSLPWEPAAQAAQPASTDSSSRANDILAMIRSRKQ